MKKEPDNKEWYKKPWGIVVAILLLPSFVIWYVWTQSNWSKKVKIGVTAVASLFVIIVLASSGTPPQQVTNQSNQTQEAKANYVFDVPALVGKNIDQVREVLGQPKDGNLIEPTAQQQAATAQWDNSWDKNNIELVVTFNSKTRAVEDFFIGTDDSSGATKDKKRLLELGNLSENATAYEVEFVKALKDPSTFTGVKAIPSPTAQAQDSSLKYEIVYTDTDQRSDGGVNFYVLIDLVDVSNNAFKDKIRATVKKIVAEKGKKISVEFHDNRDSLNVSYKQYGDQSLGRPRTQAESDLEARHFVASFDGQLDTNIYKNTLMFFPGATKSTPEVGQHVETVEFNP